MPNPGKALDDVLDPREACEQYPKLFRNPQALADMRWRGTGPAYIKTAEGRAGRVFYRRSSIERWLDEHTVMGGQRAA